VGRLGRTVTKTKLRSNDEDQFGLGCLRPKWSKRHLNTVHAYSILKSAQRFTDQAMFMQTFDEPRLTDTAARPSALTLEHYLVPRPASTVLFRVKNNALSAAGLRQGDLLVVERNAVPREGNIVVSLVGEDLCLRRIDLGAKGYITASQNDPECAYLAREGHEVVRVWGLVKHCVRAIT